MAAQKLKSFLFVNPVGTNAWLNEVAKKTGFQINTESPYHYGDLFYEDGTCDIRLIINTINKEVVIWPHLLEPDKEILKYTNESQLIGNMTTDEFVELCLKIKQIFKQQNVKAKLKEMRKDFSK
jgi:hypothetical protein